MKTILSALGLSLLILTSCGGQKKVEVDFIQDGDYSVNRGAEKLGMSVDEFEKSMSEAGYRVPELV